jgi:hypothetical protein
MTPRALLTAIGATAIAFAIAIGAAAGSVSSQTAPAIVSTDAALTSTTVQPAVALYTLAANQDCPIAV